MGEARTRKVILDFLQQNGLELRKMYSGLLDARLEDDPARLVMVMQARPNIVPKFEHLGMEIMPEIVVKDVGAVVIQGEGTAQSTGFVKDNNFGAHLPPIGVPIPEGNAPPASEVPAPNMAEAVYHGFSSAEARALGISEAIGPHSMAKDKNAFEAWKARHKVPGK